MYLTAKEIKIRTQQITEQYEALLLERKLLDGVLARLDTEKKLLATMQELHELDNINPAFKKK